MKTSYLRKLAADTELGGRTYTARDIRKAAQEIDRLRDDVRGLSTAETEREAAVRVIAQQERELGTLIAQRHGLRSRCAALILKRKAQSANARSSSVKGSHRTTVGRRDLITSLWQIGRTRRGRFANLTAQWRAEQ